MVRGNTTHGKINGVVQLRNELKIWNPQKKLVLHNSREMLSRLLNRQIRTYAQPTKKKCNDFYPKYAICMMFLCFWSKMIEYDNLNVVWCYGSCLSSLLIFPFCLKACLALCCLSSFLMQCFTNQDSNCVCDDNFVTQEMIPRYATRWWYVCYGKYDH